MGTAPKPSGFSSTRAGKTAIVERTKVLLDSTEMIITIPSAGITKENVDILKKTLGKTVVASCVKNTLMEIACQGTSFEAISSNGKLAAQNIFLFIPEGESKAAYKNYAKWRKEVNRKEDEFDAKTAVMDNVLYTGTANIDMVTSLPTKLELITKIAIGIKAVPTKVGLGVKAVPNKLGKAFALLRDKIEEEGA
jgi:large subunit ribosomal protein L10